MIPATAGAVAGPGPQATARPARRAAAVVAMLAALLLAIALSLAFGARDVPLAQVIAALFSPTGDGIAESAVRSRIPTTVAGLVVGIALGVGGALMQGMSRNPLGDPGLLGVNSGAAVAVVLAMTLGVSAAPIATVWFAFLGAAAAVIVVYGIAASSPAGATPVVLALAGAAVTAITSSIVAGLLIADASTLDRFRFWRLGSLTAASPDALLQLVPFMAVGLLIAMLQGGALNGIALGDDVAAALGQRVRTARLLSAAAVVLLCGAATALAGPIAFVGLAVPHVARGMLGADYRWILPLSGILGATFLLIADVVGRLVARPSVIEVGIVTAALGLPVFVWLIRRRAVNL